MADRSDEVEIPKGSVAAGRRVGIPRGAEEPIVVFISGVEQTRGEDYEIAGGEVTFSRPIIKEEKLSGIRWASMLIGVVGTYRKHETVDIQYNHGSKTKLAADAEVLADD